MSLFEYETKLDRDYDLTKRKYTTDKYTWQAVYNDGTDLWEYNNDVAVAKYDQIDRDKLVKFNVYETAKLGVAMKPVISLDIKPGYRLIWRKRRHQRMIGPQIPFKTVYLVGWQATIGGETAIGGGKTTIGGENVQSIIYLYEDGKMEMSSQKDDYELFEFETETQ